MSQLADTPLLHPAKEAPPLSEEEAHVLQESLPGWERLLEVDANKLRRKYTFRNFAEALEFTNRVGQLAEQENHHPMLITEWGRVTVLWWTHWLSGLHKNDYIMAARTDRLYQDGGN